MHEIPCYLVGSKLDLVVKDQSNRKVQVQEAKQLAKEYGITKHIELSAKTNTNVSAMFEDLAMMICQNRAWHHMDKQKRSDKKQNNK